MFYKHWKHRLYLIWSYLILTSLAVWPYIYIYGQTYYIALKTFSLKVMFYKTLLLNINYTNAKTDKYKRTIYIYIYVYIYKIKYCMINLIYLITNIFVYIKKLKRFKLLSTLKRNFYYIPIKLRINSIYIIFNKLVINVYYTCFPTALSIYIALGTIFVFTSITYLGWASVVLISFSSSSLALLWDLCCVTILKILINSCIFFADILFEETLLLTNVSARAISDFLGLTVVIEYLSNFRDFLYYVIGLVEALQLTYYVSHEFLLDFDSNFSSWSLEYLTNVQNSLAWLSFFYSYDSIKWVSTDSFYRIIGISFFEHSFFVVYMLGGHIYWNNFIAVTCYVLLGLSDLHLPLNWIYCCDLCYAFLSELRVELGSLLLILAFLVLQLINSWISGINLFLYAVPADFFIIFLERLEVLIWISLGWDAAAVCALCASFYYHVYSTLFMALNEWFTLTIAAFFFILCRTVFMFLWPAFINCCIFLYNMTFALINIFSELGGLAVDFCNVFLNFYCDWDLLVVGILGLVNIIDSCGGFLTGLEPGGALAYYYLAALALLLWSFNFGRVFFWALSKNVTCYAPNGLRAEFNRFVTADLRVVWMKKIFMGGGLLKFNTVDCDMYSRCHVNLVRRYVINLKYIMWRSLHFVYTESWHLNYSLMWDAAANWGGKFFSLNFYCMVAYSVNLRIRSCVKSMIRLVTDSFSFFYFRVIARALLSKLTGDRWGFFSQYPWFAYENCTYVFFPRISAIFSFPLYIAGCFNENLFWMYAHNNNVFFSFPAAMDPSSRFLAIQAQPALNSRFVRELSSVQLAFNEKRLSAGSLVGKYFQVIDEHHLVDLGGAGVKRHKSQFFFRSASELAALNFQFVCHSTFISIFFSNFDVGVFIDYMDPIDALEPEIWAYAILSSIYRFLRALTASGVIAGLLTIPVAPFALVLARITEIIFMVFGGDDLVKLTSGDDGDSSNLHNNVLLLKNLVGGVTFLDSDWLADVAYKTIDNNAWRSNPFFSWRWLHLLRTQYRLFSGHYNYLRILGGRVPRTILYAPNPYRLFELVPELFLPPSIFLDAEISDSDFVSHAETFWANFSLDRGNTQSLYVYYWNSGRFRPRLLDSTRYSSLPQFQLTEANYLRFNREFFSKFFTRRYNYFFSEMVGSSDAIATELPSVGIWSFDFSLYDKFSKSFVYNYWGKKQAFSLKFLDYNKYQFFKKLKIGFWRAPPRYLIRLRQKIWATRSSTPAYIDSRARDRLTHDLTFFFLTVYDEFLSKQLLSREFFSRGDYLFSKLGHPQLSWVVYDELIDWRQRYLGNAFLPLVYVEGAWRHCVVNLLNFWLKLYSFFMHVGAAPYLVFYFDSLTRVIAFLEFSTLPYSAAAQTFHLYVFQTNTVFLLNRFADNDLFLNIGQLTRV